MSTQQPNWKLVANLGDVNVAEYGGFLVYVDTTGVYAPEVEMYEAKDDETGGMMSRFILERNPAGEWWFDKLQDVANSCGQEVAEYKSDLASGDPIKVASVYRDVVAYFGAYEFDQYPVTLTEKEAQKRYAKVKTV